MIHRFEQFELDTETATLRHGGRTIDLSRKVVATLGHLVANPGRVISKDELMSVLWPDGFVEEGNLTQNIHLIRKMLRGYGMDGAVVTHTRRGFSFEPPAKQHATERPHWSRFALPVLLAFVVAAVPSARGHMRVAIGAAAFRDYTMGRYYWNLRTVSGMQQSIAYFERVVRSAPQSPLGYAGVADAYTELADLEQPCSPCTGWANRARAFARRAVEADPDSSEARVSLAMTQRIFDHDDAAAYQNFRAAIALDEKNALAHQWYGNMLIAQGKLQSGIAELQVAASSQPVATATYAWLARAEYYEGRNREAEYYAREALKLDPQRFETNVLLSLILSAQNDERGALHQIDRIGRLGDRDQVLALQAGVFAHFGASARAKSLLTALDARRSSDPYARREEVYTLALLGERGAARQLLHRVSFATPLDRELFELDPRHSLLASVGYGENS